MAALLPSKLGACDEDRHQSKIPKAHFDDGTVVRIGGKGHRWTHLMPHSYYTCKILQIMSHSRKPSGSHPLPLPLPLPARCGPFAMVFLTVSAGYTCAALLAGAATAAELGGRGGRSVLERGKTGDIRASSNKKLLVTSATLVVTKCLLVVTRSY